MIVTRRDSLKLAGAALASAAAARAFAQDLTTDKLPPRMPLDEFVRDADLMKALIRGVRAMQARKPSDPLSWFYQAAIHGVTPAAVQIAAADDPDIAAVDQKKHWNQCPHFGQASANFLPFHRAYMHYFERILRAQTGEPRFALPYWDYAKAENYRFPREYGVTKLAAPIDGDDSNPLYHAERNVYFTDWEHWSGDNYPYSQLTPEAVDWSPARDCAAFFGLTEREGLAGAIADQNTSTRGRLESFPHDPIHRVVGGLIQRPPLPNPNDPANPIPQPPVAGGMADPQTAAFDPIFCVHHSNIDRLWAEWSMMGGKDWGHFPPPAWFDETAWVFFDVAMKDGSLAPVEVSRPRKDFFDHRALGTVYKYEDLSKAPLALPDPIPASPQVVALVATPLARIAAPSQVSGLRAERFAVAPVASSLNAPFERARRAAAPGTGEARVLMRINGVDISAVTATGFDVHLVADVNAKPKRTDPSFVGAIALFRHDQHATPSALAMPSAAHADGMPPSPTMPAATPASDTFDVTDALRAAGQTDPSKMHVVIVPVSLAATVDGQKTIAETTGLKFANIEFLSKG
jgi:hypothetical protein